MKTCENYISNNSEYFVYSPSKIAHDIFFYPLQCGHFYYQAGYSVKRDSYNSYLIIFIASGSLHISTEDGNYIANQGDFVLLNCYKPHGYHTEENSEIWWCHYDGPLAYKWFEQITLDKKLIFSAPELSKIQLKLKAIYDVFAMNLPIKEAQLSKNITDILTAFLLTNSDTSNKRASRISESVIAYINEHFKEKISAENLAQKAGLSTYHFIRTFKKETGFTPHEYLINIRLSTAKYLLKNTSMPIKDICYECGFSDESIFCTAFKNKLGATPSEYRSITLRVRSKDLSWP